jgi:hypothetical protein
VLQARCVPSADQLLRLARERTGGFCHAVHRGRAAALLLCLLCTSASTCRSCRGRGDGDSRNGVGCSELAAAGCTGGPGNVCMREVGDVQSARVLVVQRSTGTAMRGLEARRGGAAQGCSRCSRHPGCSWMVGQAGSHSADVLFLGVFLPGVPQVQFSQGDAPRSGTSASCSGASGRGGEVL